MSANSKIDWCDSTWNPVRGCTKISAGCKNCYAERFAERWRGIPGHPFEQGFDLRLVPKKLNLPLTWKKPKKIFVNSVSDLFHKDVPESFIAQVMNTIRISQARDLGHTFQVLTKRADRMAYLMPRLRFDSAGEGRVWFADSPDSTDGYPLAAGHRGATGLQNLQLGVSVENQPAADERIPLLLQTPAAVRFLSCEPLLEAVDLGIEKATCDCCSRWGNRWVRLPKRVYADFAPGFAEPGIYKAGSNPHGALSVRMEGGGLLGIRPAEFEVLPGIDWVIAGGESGHGARPMHPDWARSLRDQCQAAGVPFFFKQWGEWGPYNNSRDTPEELAKLENPKCMDTPLMRHGKKAAGRLLDGREWNEYPEANPE